MSALVPDEVVDSAERSEHGAALRWCTRQEGGGSRSSAMIDVADQREPCEMDEKMEGGMLSARMASTPSFAISADRHSALLRPRRRSVRPSFVRAAAGQGVKLSLQRVRQARAHWPYAARSPIGVRPGQVAATTGRGGGGAAAAAMRARTGLLFWATHAALRLLLLPRTLWPALRSCLKPDV